LASLILLIVIRFIGGVFMGGEYPANNTLALEMVPKIRRGFVACVPQGAYHRLWGWRIALGSSTPEAA